MKKYNRVYTIGQMIQSIDIFNCNPHCSSIDMIKYIGAIEASYVFIRFWSSLFQVYHI